MILHVDSCFDYICYNSSVSWNSDHVVLNHDTTRDGGLKISYILQFVVMLQITLHSSLNPYPTAFPYGNGTVLHFYQQQESSTTKTVHKVINKGLKTYV